MKYFRYALWVFATAIFLFPDCHGQTNISGPDSVIVFKAKRNRNIYQFSDSGINEIQYSMKQPKEAKFSNTGSILGDMGKGFLTVLTSINFATSKDLVWDVSGQIACTDPLPGWDISLFCEGHLEKDRERVQNDDGSWSVATESTRFMYWEKNATGVIIERGDTIGSFLIIMNPWTNELLKQWSAGISSEPEAQIQTSSNNRYYKTYISYSNISYGIIGEFRKKEFAIISNGDARKTWFYNDNNLSCIFSPDMDETIVSKKDRVQPYLLIDGKIYHSERYDYFRLAIVSRFLTQALKL